MSTGSNHYELLIIDSLSHAWAGPAVYLEFVDARTESAKGNKFAGWREATPKHNSLVDAMLHPSRFFYLLVVIIFNSTTGSSPYHSPVIPLSSPGHPPVISRSSPFNWQFISIFQGVAEKFILFGFLSPGMQIVIGERKILKGETKMPDGLT